MAWSRPALSPANEKLASVRSGLFYSGFCNYAGFPCHGLKEVRENKNPWQKDYYRMITKRS